MKNFLIGLLALGSFNVFAQDLGLSTRVVDAKVVDSKLSISIDYNKGVLFVPKLGKWTKQLGCAVKNGNLTAEVNYSYTERNRDFYYGLDRKTKKFNIDLAQACNGELPETVYINNEKYVIARGRLYSAQSIVLLNGLKNIKNDGRFQFRDCMVSQIFDFGGLEIRFSDNSASQWVLGSFTADAIIQSVIERLIELEKAGKCHN